MLGRLIPTLSPNGGVTQRERTCVRDDSTTVRTCGYVLELSGKIELYKVALKSLRVQTTLWSALRLILVLAFSIRLSIDG